jgi:hypothetical protein
MHDQDVNAKMQEMVVKQGSSKKVGRCKPSSYNDPAYTQQRSKKQVYIQVHIAIQQKEN